MVRSPIALRIDRRCFRAVLVHLVAAAPDEGVGLLAVVAEGEADRVTRFYPGTNMDRSPSRYTMEPAEVLAAFRDIDARGWRFGAIVHSHPATPPTPSPTDLGEAYYPDALLMIVGLAAATPEARVWRLARSAEGGAVAASEVPLVVDNGGGGEATAERGSLGASKKERS